MLAEVCMRYSATLTVMLPSSMQINPSERNTFMSRMYAEGSRAYKEDEDAKVAINELAKQSFTREDPTYAAVYDTNLCMEF
jgi:hypothetical protein